MYPSFGIFKAIVTDNSTFFKTGKIKVRISEFYNTNIDWNLTTNYNEEKFADLIKTDIYAVVFTPFGGGYNHGFFALPQINSTGVVQFLNGNPNKPIWMGSYFNPEYDDENKIERVNVPNDTPGMDKGPSSDGITSDGKNIEGDEGTIIFRQKSTTPPNGDADNMNFDKQDTQNMSVMGKEKFEFYHFTKWDEEKGAIKYSKIELLDDGENPTISIKSHDYTDNENPKSIGFYADEKEAKLDYTNVETKKSNVVKVNKEGTQITASNLDTGESTNILMETDTITISNKDNAILIEQDDISISSPNNKVRLSGTEVILGAGGGYVVTSNSPNPIRMEDGSVLSKSTTVKA